MGQPWSVQGTNLMVTDQLRFGGRSGKFFALAMEVEFAGKIIEPKGELSIAMFDYRMVCWHDDEHGWRFQTCFSVKKK